MDSPATRGLLAAVWAPARVATLRCSNPVLPAKNDATRASFFIGCGEGGIRT